MALAETERLTTRPSDIPLTNEDGTYTYFGAWLEIANFVHLVPEHEDQIIQKFLLAREKRGHPMNRVDHPEGLMKGIVLLVDQKIPLLNPRKKHEKKQGDEGEPTDLEYFIDTYRYTADDGKENVIFAARVPRGGRSSSPSHTHGWNVDGQPVVEHYFKFSKGKLYVGEGEQKREMGKYEPIPPDEHHRIQAGENEDDDAVIIMLLENVKGIPNEELHKYFPQKAA